MQSPIIIIGATGFVGTNLLELLSPKYKIIAITRSNLVNVAGVEWYKVKSHFNGTLSAILNEHPNATVIHAAGKINGSRNELYNSNYYLTCEIINEIKTVTQKAKIIYISSITAKNQIGDYGGSKFHAESAIAKSGLNWLNLRASMLYGPHETQNLALLIHMIKNWKIIPSIGHNSLKLQPLYIKDLAQLIDNILQQPTLPDRAVVATGPQLLYLEQIIRTLQKQLNSCKKTISLPLTLVQLGVQTASWLLPFSKLPLQQINEATQPRNWECDYACKNFDFQPTKFSNAIAEYIKKS